MLALLPAAVATAYTFLRKEINSHMFRLHFWILFLFRRFFLNVEWYYIQKYGYYKSFKAHSSTHKHTCTRIPKCHSKVWEQDSEEKESTYYILGTARCGTIFPFSFFVFFVWYVRVWESFIFSFWSLHTNTLSLYAYYISRNSTMCHITRARAFNAKFREIMII